MKQLPSLKHLRECLTYNPRTGEFYWKERPLRHFSSERVWKRWNSTYAGTLAGTVMRAPGGDYYSLGLDGGRYLLHRIAWKMHYGKDPINLIDHRDGNGLNNRVRNLRSADTSKNGFNKRIASNNTSGFKGVTVNRAGRFQAQIGVNGRMQYLGVFDTAEEAATVVSTARRKLHGAFARSN